MKTIRVLAILLAVLVAAGCGKKTVKVEKRWGLYYEVNSETPFTGKGTLWFYENGQKQDEYEYRDGKEDGKFTYWYENGQKMEEGEIRNGEMKGKFTSWYRNGQKKIEEEYRDNAVVSQIKWDENGNQIK